MPNFKTPNLIRSIERNGVFLSLLHHGVSVGSVLLVSAYSELLFTACSSCSYFLCIFLLYKCLMIRSYPVPNYQKEGYIEHVPSHTFQTVSCCVKKELKGNPNTNDNRIVNSCCREILISVSVIYRTIIWVPHSSSNLEKTFALRSTRATLPSFVLEIRLFEKSLQPLPGRCTANAVSRFSAAGGFHTAGTFPRTNTRGMLKSHLW